MWGKDEEELKNRKSELWIGNGGKKRRGMTAATRENEWNVKEYRGNHENGVIGI